MQSFLNGGLLATVEICKFKIYDLNYILKTHVSEISHKYYMGNLHYMQMSTVISVQELCTRLLTIIRFEFGC